MIARQAVTQAVARVVAQAVAQAVTQAVTVAEAEADFAAPAVPADSGDDAEETSSRARISTTKTFS